MRVLKSRAFPTFAVMLVPTLCARELSFLSDIMASGTESATETSYWLKFFTEAQIPAGDAAHYAVLFSDNRIQRHMLLDLTKEYITDMGVSRLGDVIAILKHAKTVHDQDAKDKALKGAKYTTTPASPLRRSTAASRMVDHFLKKTPESAPMSQPPAPKPSNTGSGKKWSVFDRLGSDSSGSSPKLSGGGEGSVFSRLGGKTGQKRAASSTSPDDSDDDDDDDDDTPHSPLGYHGILKFPASAKKTTPVPRKKIRVTMQDDPVQITGFEKVKVTGQKKVKVTGLERVKVGGNKAESFDPGDLQSLKVQVSSTTSTPKVKRRTTSVPDSSSLDLMLTSVRKAAVQKAEVTTTTPLTRTAGVLSMDAPSQAASVKTRLGPKVQKVAASSTTVGFGPSTKTLAGDVKSRLGATDRQPANTNSLTSSSKLKLRLGTTTNRQTASTSSPTSSSALKSRLGAKRRATSGSAVSSSTRPSPKPSAGVFSRLGKKVSAS